MKTRLAISLAAASLLASSAAFAQSTTEQGARDGARAGGDIGGPIGAMVGGTVGAAVGAGLEIPNAILGGIPRSDAPQGPVQGTSLRLSVDDLDDATRARLDDHAAVVHDRIAILGVVRHRAQHDR